MPFFKNPQRRFFREIKVFSIMQAEYPLSAAGRGKQGRRVLSSHTDPVQPFRNRNCVHLSTAD